MGDTVRRLSNVVNIGILPDSDLILDLTALEFSALDYPQRSLRHLHMLLDRTALEVGSMLKPNLLPREQAQVLEIVLCRAGFACASEPLARSSDTLRALETRRGTPLMLAILYVGAARRAGLDAAVMEIVSGVVIRLGPDHRHVFVGVGATGFGVLDTGYDRTAYVVSPYPPLSNRMTLVMLMDEEAVTCERRGDFVRASSLYDRICVIAPSHHVLWWKKATVEIRLKRYHAARTSLLSILELTRNEHIRKCALDALANIASR